MSESKNTRVQVLVDIFQAIEDEVGDYSLIQVGEQVDMGDMPLGTGQKTWDFHSP